MSKLDAIREVANRLQAYQGFSVAARGAPTENEEEFAADFDAMKAALPALLAVAEALDWCREHLADVEYDHYPAEPPHVRVGAQDRDTGKWREVTAPTLVEAVAKLRSLEEK